MEELAHPDAVDADEPDTSVPSSLAGGEGTWPFACVFLLSWMLPATTARKTGHIGLLKAFGYHVACFLSFIVLAPMVASAILEDSPFEIWGEMINVAARQPTEFSMVMGILVALVEGIGLVLALLLMPWGARAGDAKSRFSLYHALRCVWLQSTHVVIVSLLLVAAAAAWDVLRRELLFDSGGNWSDLWYFRYDGELFFHLGTCLYAWTLWGMLRATGARPVVRPQGRPPTCQVCGYNLTAAAAEGACPECGEPVSASLGPASRPGIDWERSSCPGWLERWARTAWAAMRHPTRFGRELQVYSAPGAHRRFLMVSMGVSGALGVAGAVLWLSGLLQSGHYYGPILPSMTVLTLPACGLFGALAPLAIPLLLAGVLGLALGLPMGRNATPAAMRCATYLSGFVVLGMVLNLPLAYLFGIASGVELFDLLARVLRIDDESVAVGLWVLADAAWLIVFVNLLQRMVRAARYADR